MPLLSSYGREQTYWCRHVGICFITLFACTLYGYAVALAVGLDYMYVFGTL